MLSSCLSKRTNYIIAWSQQRHVQKSEKSDFRVFSQLWNSDFQVELERGVLMLKTHLGFFSVVYRWELKHHLGQQFSFIFSNPIGSHNIRRVDGCLCLMLQNLDGWSPTEVCEWMKLSQTLSCSNNEGPLNVSPLEPTSDFKCAFCFLLPLLCFCFHSFLLITHRLHHARTFQPVTGRNERLHLL